MRLTEVEETTLTDYFGKLARDLFSFACVAFGLRIAFKFAERGKVVTD